MTDARRKPKAQHTQGRKYLLTVAAGVGVVLADFQVGLVIE